MSTDEYSQDIPDELYLQHHQRSGSANSYPNLGSSSSCSLPMPSNLELMQMQSSQMQHQQGLLAQDLGPEQQQQPMQGQRQKRKYTRRKHPEERKKRGPRTKDLNAPRMPLNGYVRFLNANRERVKAENPELTFAEVTKRLASEWSSMTNDEKKAYLDEAEKAKEMYLKELHDYQQTDSYQEFINMKERAKQQQPNIDQSMVASPQMVPSPQSQASQQMSSQSVHQGQLYPASTPSPHFYPDQNQQQQQQMHPNQYSSMYQQQPQSQHPNSYSQYNMNGSNKYSSSCMSATNAPGISGSTGNGSYSNSSSYYSGGNSMSQSQASSYNNNNMPVNMYQQQQQHQRGYGTSMPVSGNGISAHHHMGSSAASNLSLNNPIVPDRSGGITPGSMAFQSILDQCDSVVDLPIFTEEFLEHNKMREQELRNYRALTQEYEEENAILSKHVDDIKIAVDKLSADEAREIETNGRLRNVFDRLQQNLVDCFQDISIPVQMGESSSCQYGQQQQLCGPPTAETMDQFMTGLNKLRMNPCKNDSLVQSIRSAVTSLDEVAF